MEECVYFAGAIRGGRENREIYARIIATLSAYGTVLTEHVGDEDLSSAGETESDEREIFRRDVEWLGRASAVVAEVTIPSLGVGYEIGRAEAAGKKILCLARQGSSGPLSAMIVGNPAVSVREYRDVAEIPAILREFFGRG